LTHIRPGRWRYETSRSIASFDQYQHLAYLTKALNHDKVLKTMLGANSDYIVAPDIVVSRLPITDEEINQNTVVLDDNQSIAANTRLRIQNNPDRPLLHASISCKWTIRSDRTQNTRTEALNLIRNRKGNLPHIVAVTAEPLPTRIAAIALGTGDLDCVYHFALPELRQSLIDLENEDQLDMLDLMVGGMRLRDISDLPFDLAV
ncbi:MAG: restriction endonuclease, partial [Caldilineaceae bacterium]|nr:restriction endonuclease [Caldilineaceae bacterium]